MDADALAIPEGFELVDHTGPFLREVGPLYYRREGEELTVGLRLAERHSNSRGVVHGGMLLAMADTALGMALYHSRVPPQPIATVSLNAEFLDSALPGDWVEAKVEILRIGSRLAYANCLLYVGARRVMRAAGVFALMRPKHPQEESDG